MLNRWKCPKGSKRSDARGSGFTLLLEFLSLLRRMWPKRPLAATIQGWPVLIVLLLASCTIEYESCADALDRVGKDDVLLATARPTEFGVDYCAEMPLSSHYESGASHKLAGACPGICADEASKYVATIGAASLSEDDVCSDAEPAIRSAHQKLLEEGFEEIRVHEQRLIECYESEAGVSLKPFEAKPN